MENYTKILDYDDLTLKKIIIKSCSIKSDVVQDDEKENGKRALLNHFGSARAVESASFEEIKSVEGIEDNIAKKIYNYFHE